MKFAERLKEIRKERNQYTPFSAESQPEKNGGFCRKMIKIGESV